MTLKVAKSADQTSAESTAQLALGFQGTPLSAIVYAIPEIIWACHEGNL
jgi:hypothetical protein